MRVSEAVLRRARTATVTVFIVVLSLAFAVLWVRMGGEIPGVTGGYRVTATLSDAQNLVYDSAERHAGVQVGKVRALGHHGGRAETTLEFRGAAHPLHQGAAVPPR